MDHLLALVVIIHSWMLMADVHSFLAIHELLCCALPMNPVMIQNCWEHKCREFAQLAKRHASR